MDKEQKILAVVFIVIIIFGLGLFYNRQNISSLVDLKLNSVAKSVVGDQYSGWQTYTNKQYGYSIRYPNGFHIDIKDSDKAYTKAGNGGDTEILNYYHSNDSTPLKETDMSVSYFFMKADPKFPPDKYIDAAASQLAKFEKFNLNGSPAVKYTEYNYNNKGISFDHITSVNGDKIFNFTYIYNDSSTMSMRELADKIAGSFTFTK